MRLEPVIGPKYCIPKGETATQTTMKPTTLIVTAFAACGLCAGTALAANPTHTPATHHTTKKPPAEDEFKKLDTNKDGKLSQDEYVAGAGNTAEEFGKLDVNKDGFLSHSEFAAKAKDKDKKK